MNFPERQLGEMEGQSPGVRVEGHMKPCRFQSWEKGGGQFGPLETAASSLSARPGAQRGTGPHPLVATGKGLMQSREGASLYAKKMWLENSTAWGAGVGG